MTDQNNTTADSPVALTSNLVIYADGEEAIQYVLNAKRICVGRGPGSQILVKHPAVSFSHLELVKNDSGDYEVSDLGSRNGIHINGKKATQAVLKDGDRMLIGGAIAAYFLVLPDDAEAIDPVIVAADGEQAKARKFFGLAEQTNRLEEEYKKQKQRTRDIKAEIVELEAELLRQKNLSKSLTPNTTEPLPANVTEPLETIPDGSKEVETPKVQRQLSPVKVVNRVTNGNAAPAVKKVQARNGRN